MNRLSISLITLLVVGPGQLFAANNWNEMCNADGKISQKSSDIPNVNYKNKLVKEVAKRLSEVESTELSERELDGKQKKSVAFNLYSDFEAAYNLCAGKAKYSSNTSKCGNPEGVGVNAHNMLTILCGEYRDNESLYVKKMEWLSKLTITQDASQSYDKEKEVFAQITGDGYEGLITLSQDVFSHRKNEIGYEFTQDYLTLEQKSVEPMTICEYRFMLDEYLSKEISSVSMLEFPAYKEGLAKYEAKCSKHDLDHYYEFRGDGNLKAQSLESNGNIWLSRVFTNSCKNDRSLSRSAYGTAMSKSDCTNYFKNPFKTRTSLNEQGLLRLLFSPEEAQGLKIMDMLRNYHRGSGDLVFMTEDINKDGLGELIVLDPKKTSNCYDEKSGACIVLKAREAIQSEDSWAVKAALEDIMKTHIIAAIGEKLSEESSKYNKLVNGNNYKSRKSSYSSYLASLTYSVNREISTQKNKLEKEGISESARVSAEDRLYSAQEDLESITYFVKSYLGEDFNFEKIKTDGIHLITEAHPEWKAEYAKRDKLGKPLYKDFGFTKIFKGKDVAWDRLATVLDRHTDWYMIDMFYIKGNYYKPTFSPWLASSYTIDKSHAFVIPGYAMGQRFDEGRMHWMYVQKVEKSKWYKAENMNSLWPASAENFDLLNFWFDETTFSRSGLGAHEHGWDRFGQAGEDEMGEIIWLYQAPYFE